MTGEKAGSVRAMASHYHNLIKGVEYIFTSVDMGRHLYIARTVRKLCGPIQERIKVPDVPLTHLVKGRGATLEARYQCK